MLERIVIAEISAVVSDLRPLLPYGIHERLGAYAVGDLEPDATVGIGVLCRERRDRLLYCGKDGIEIAAPFCHAPSLEVGGGVLYARTRMCTRARGLATRDIFDIPSVHYAYAYARARGRGC